jgi:hypothetical protein
MDELRPCHVDAFTAHSTYNLFSRTISPSWGKRSEATTGVGRLNGFVKRVDDGSTAMNVRTIAAASLITQLQWYQ